MQKISAVYNQERAVGSLGEKGLLFIGSFQMKTILGRPVKQNQVDCCPGRSLDKDIAGKRVSLLEGSGGKRMLGLQYDLGLSLRASFHVCF